MGFFSKSEPATPPTAAELEEKRAQGRVSEAENVYKQVQKDHAAAIKGLEKLTIKQKSIQTKAETEVAKLEKKIKDCEAQNDKVHKKIKDMMKKQESTANRESSDQQKAEKEVTKAQSALEKSRQKLQTGIAQKKAIKDLYKLQLEVDHAERHLAAQQKRAQLVPTMIKLEIQHLQNKIQSLNDDAAEELSKYKYKLQVALYDRDLALAELETDIVKAQLAVQQYEKHLTYHREDLLKANQDLTQVLDAEVTAAHERAATPEPNPEPVPEPQPEQEGAGERAEEEAAPEHEGDHEEGAAEGEHRDSTAADREAEHEGREHGDGEEEELPPVPQVPTQ